MAISDPSRQADIEAVREISQILREDAEFLREENRMLRDRMSSILARAAELRITTRRLAGTVDVTSAPA